MSINSSNFRKCIVENNIYTFESLKKSALFEDIALGRKGGVLVSSENNIIPIVRTTTKYIKPAKKFSKIHHELIANIKTAACIPKMEFNNALIEIYDHQYRKMGYHSDQNTDLEKDSYICLFSCYNNPNTTN